ncbi:helix-turn-helix domain-containing protein [Streptomyces sp. MBT42]|uniref:helix-turn-helix domain-containing protein n=1 Tax=Streptomyces sp. MBT42 TaxID=1488373 RepID=UPI001E3A471C|nr:helix-turn-helix domain-containing protein [Streptomyces sp. MBT42]MCD2466430.1 helix-turn-helix domain-containing protein [Streptomyces sp. MBT42]
MEALAVRLSGLDPYVDGALRIVAFYDTLMRRRVDLPALARASAGLAECVAGVGLRGTGRTIRVGPDGREAPGAAGPASVTVPVVLDEEEIGTVWLERAGPAGPLDEVLLDRLALAVAGAVERYGPARTTMADPALVELVIGAETDEAARARALRLLGFAVGPVVRVAAVRSPRLPLDQVGGAVCPGGPVKAARIGGVGVLLAPGMDRDRFPAGVRAGLGAADRPDLAWREARTALRLTTAREPVLDHAELGALALLAEVPREVLRGNPDVAALVRLAGAPGDAEEDARGNGDGREAQAPREAQTPREALDTLNTLEAYCAAGSLRRAADALHLHHSSVARRVDLIGRALSVDLTTPTGLTRARMALAAWRLLGD